MIILYTIFTFCTIIFLKFINLYLFSQYHLLFHQFCVILLLTLLLIVKVFPAQEGINVYNSVSLTRLSALLRRFFLFFYCQRKEDFLTCRTPELLYLELFLLLMILLKNSIICSASIVIISLDEWESLTGKKIFPLSVSPLMLQMISLVLFPEKSECCPASVVKQSTPKVNHYHFIWRN